MTAAALPTPHTDPWQRVAAVVVTHHSGAVIGQCLGPLTKAAQLIVVDNASADDTLDVVARVAPACTLLKNRIGAGYGNGASQGLAVVEAEFALLANPDSVVDDEALGQLIAAADRYPDGALFGPTVLDGNGKIELSHDVGLFDRRRYGRRDDEPAPQGPCCAEFLSGAVTLLRMSAYRTVGREQRTQRAYRFRTAGCRYAGEFDRRGNKESGGQAGRAGYRQFAIRDRGCARQSAQ